MEREMTSRERVKKAVHFEGPDRIPHYLPDGKENDILWIWVPKPPPIQDWTNVGDTDEMIDCWGTKYQRAAGGVLGRGEVLQPVLPDITKQAEYKIPDLHTQEALDEVRRQIEENAASDNPKYVLCVMPYSSLNEGTHNLMGIENMFLAYYEHPDKLKTFIGRLSALQAESIRILAELGCDGVMGYDDWGLQDSLMVGTPLIEEFFMPHYRGNWGLAHKLGMDVWLHSCGNIIDILPAFIEAGLNVIQQDQQENMGLEVLAKKFGGDLAFWCPVDIQKTMIEGTPEDVRNYAKRLIETLGAFNGGYISMAYSTPEDVNHSPENMSAMCAAFREFEKY
jgi:uroporphyrinogen-III decarboxylase